MVRLSILFIKEKRIRLAHHELEEIRSLAGMLRVLEDEEVLAAAAVDRLRVAPTPSTGGTAKQSISKSGGSAFFISFLSQSRRRPWPRGR